MNSRDIWAGFDRKFHKVPGIWTLSLNRDLILEIVRMTSLRGTHKAQEKFCKQTEEEWPSREQTSIFNFVLVFFT